MTVRYAITFEFDRLPPLTHRGTVTASNVATCVARATRLGKRSLRPRAWKSVVVVLLERVNDPVGLADVFEQDGDVGSYD